MICEACRERRHGECRGGTWCDCQHKPSTKEPAEQHAEGHPDEPIGEPGEDDGSEPRVNWLRQG